MKWETIILAFATIILGACASNYNQIPAAGEYAVIPLVRVVLPKDQNLQDAVTHIQNESLTFNDQYHRPDLPERLIQVQCDDTDRIAVIFDLSRQNTHTGRTVRFRSIWTHSNAEIQDDMLDSTKRIGLESGRKTKLVIASLRVMPKFKVDGVWSLSVAINDNVLFRDSFELIGCSGSDQ